ncbi:5'/3'-nucleotidase SurE [Prochlorothrix hollandica]|uniref:5'-nucleotidase SurE n=1 Tax=Prochlorothrix hollandica PCC 9006 = CALU 1027 TaxID=317619 RepID=A0A0M2PQ74_PROHO|nr:5'/3'-nucleotidase SurE [Prochlorothrix hollandica]KKI98730.1 5'-nucleotidase [Prochlorothrix hollandica PCC 9006 = CALU 1027]
MAPHILVSNDDGIFALGIKTLANTLARSGYRVTVVCPDRERSATGHGLTLHRPIRAEAIDTVFDPGIRAWACSGTPSDCVKLALGALLDSPPDFVYSGINHGPNLGSDVLYSGTVSAAMEGTIDGIPSVAFSLADFTGTDFQPAADFACALIPHLQAHPLPPAILLSVNVPPLPTSAMAGVMITRQGVRRYVDSFERRQDPRGKTYFWLAGEVLEEVIDPHSPPALLTDVQAMGLNYITLTPLQYNLTAFDALASLQSLPLPPLA